jgi:hypothetical protein
VIQAKSQYVNKDHYVILIDGNSLDLRLHNLYPEELFLGLIPTIADWMSIDEEAKFVQQRFTMDQECKIVSILMCPDDCDLFCTLIVAEVLISGDYIKWRRIGVDHSEIRHNNYEMIGTKVTWLEKVPEMIFDKEEYKQLEKIYINTQDN